MPAFLVQIPEGAARLVEGADTFAVFAADVAGARSAVAGMFDGDANALWNSVATVTQIVAGTTLADSSDGWSAFCRISGAAAQTVNPIVVEVKGLTRNVAANVLTQDRLHVGAVAVNSGGTATYAVNDILTAAGGTFTRAATFRVTTVNVGVITAVELVDPGEYTVLPSMTANAVTGGGGSAATMDLTQADVGGYEALLAQMVTDLNTQADIAAAAVDMSEGGTGARLLTLAAAGDGLGDAAVTFEVRHNGVAFAPLVGTVTSGGVAGAALTVAIPASPIAPPRVTALKSV